MKKIENFKTFKQISKDDCWIASSKMVLDFFKLKNDYNTLIKQANSINPSIQGSKEGIIELLNIYNLKYKSQMSVKGGGDLDDNSARKIIETNIDSGFPVIIGLPGHAVVVIGYSNNEIIIVNPLNEKEESIKYKNLTFGDICYNS